MRIAVTSQGPGAASKVDSRFARARFFVLFDPDTGVFTSYENAPSLREVPYPGVRAAEDLLELGVDGVITGSIGGKAFAMLQAAGVVVYIAASGTVMDAIDQYEAGRVPCALHRARDRRAGAERDVHARGRRSGRRHRIRRVGCARAGGHFHPGACFRLVRYVRSASGGR